MNTRERDLEHAAVALLHADLAPDDGIGNVAELLQAERELIADSAEKSAANPLHTEPVRFALRALAARIRSAAYLALPADAEQGGR